MNRERWQLLKEIFSKALEQPSELRDRFVRDAVGTDTELLSELRRLLDEHEREDSALSRPALQAERFPDDAPPQFAPDATLAGRFRLVRYIARGGMGEVYEAEDLVLKERVALKTIRAELAQDAHVLEMFTTEIQLARKVTHPNVCRIHDFAQHVEEGRVTSFLTMELLSGHTLAQHIQRFGALNPGQALPVMEQLSAALAAAHAAGVIHRDLKPGNIMVVEDAGGSDARIVVTDFGMAILAREASPASGPYFPGTPRYMAPEQVEGRAVTQATDVYSLALVIAEMIGARKHATAGSRIKTLLGISRAKYETPRISVPASFPGWDVVLQRCLSHEPQARYAGPAEVMEALRAARDGGRKRRRTAAGVGIVLSALAVLGYFQPWRYFSRSLTPASRPLFVEDAAFSIWGASPDGRLLAATLLDTVGNLAVRDVQTAETRTLTNNTDGSAMNALFSPDGKWIVFGWQPDSGDMDLRVVSIDGTGQRTIFRDSTYTVVTPADWSPDGRRILASFLPVAGAAQIGWIDFASGAVTFLNTQGRPLWDPRFSADGSALFVNTRRGEDDEATDIVKLSLAGTELGRPVEHSADDILVGLSPNRSQLIFTSDRQGTVDLWSVPADTGAATPRRLWPNLGRVEALSMTSSGAFFYRLWPQVQSVYYADIDLAAGRGGDPHRALTRFKAPSLWSGWSPDGRQLVFLYRTEEPALAIHTLATQQTRLLHPQLASFGRPQWHPSGAWIDVVGTDRQGRQGHFRVNPVTGEAVPWISTRELQSGFEGVWAKDGVTTFNRFTVWERGIFSYRYDTKVRRVLYVPPSGINIGQENLALSPDGKWLVFQARQRAAGISNLMLMPLSGGEAKSLLAVRNPETFPMGSFAWTPDSKAVLAARTTNELSELWRVPIDGTAADRIEFPSGRIAQMKLSPNGDRVAFTSGQEKSEIWVLENLFGRN